MKARLKFACFVCAASIVAAFGVRNFNYRRKLNNNLIAAARRLDEKTLAVCLANGADPNAHDASTAAPLWVRILETGSSPDEVASAGDTALMVALENGSDIINLPPSDGDGDAFRKLPAYTALPVIVADLLKRGANSQALNRYGNSAIAYAVSCECTEAVSILLEHGASPNDQCVEGSSLLIYAVTRSDLDTVYVLISHGADLNKRSSSGISPLGYARKNGDENIERLLQSRGAVL